MAVVHVVKSWFLTLLFFWRRKRLSTQGSTLSVVRGSSIKPPRVSARPVELFYKRRLVWTLVQLVALSALAVWTIKNYIAVIHSL